ncbi:MAG: hypothetical protein KDA98_03705 [Acidimicrobiales bacterium]|nr:hypothetical protein [Acidimicrobiales bacterium]
MDEVVTVVPVRTSSLGSVVVGDLSASYPRAMAAIRMPIAVVASPARRHVVAWARLGSEGMPMNRSREAARMAPTGATASGRPTMTKSTPITIIGSARRRATGRDG